MNRIICSRTDIKGLKTARCAYCGRPSEALCDFVLTDGPRKGRTCDKPVCDVHRTRKGPHQDCCWHHRAEQVEA